MLKVNKDRLFDFLEGRLETVDTMTNREILLAIMGAQFLQDHHKFHATLGTAETGAALVLGLAASAPIWSVLAVVTGTVGVWNTVSNYKKHKSLKVLEMTFANKLLTRYDSFPQAYVELYDMTLKIEREEILDYFKQGGAM